MCGPAMWVTTETFEDYFLGCETGPEYQARCLELAGPRHSGRRIRTGSSGLGDMRVDWSAVVDSYDRFTATTTEAALTLEVLARAVRSVREEYTYADRGNGWAY